LLEIFLAEIAFGSTALPIADLLDLHDVNTSIRINTAFKNFIFDLFFS